MDVKEIEILLMVRNSNHFRKHSMEMKMNAIGRKKLKILRAGE